MSQRACNLFPLSPPSFSAHNWQLSKQNCNCCLAPSILRLEMQPGVRGVRLYNFSGYFDASSLIMQPAGLRLINNVLHSLLPVRWSVINQRLLCKRNAVPPGNGSAPQYATRAATTATRSVEITSHVMPSHSSGRTVGQTCIYKYEYNTLSLSLTVCIYV